MTKFANLKLSAKLTLAFSLVIVIMLITGFFGLFETERQAEVTSKIYLEAVQPFTQVAKVATRVKGLRIDVFRALAGTDGEHNEEYIQQLKQKIAAIDAEIRRVSGAAGGETGENLRKAWGALSESYGTIFEQIANFEMEDAMLALATTNKDLAEGVDSTIEALQNLFEGSVETGFRQSQAIEWQATVGTAGMLAGGVFLAIVLVLMLNRSIPRPFARIIQGMTDVSARVTSASNQVADSSNSLAEGASQQAASLEETSATLEEMASMTRQNAENTGEANSQAVENRARSEKAREAMARMLEAINQIKGASDQTAAIIKTIDEIAFQTNLLALNAAVEAARAGDAGRGFAVVAEEVRNLAGRSAEATKTTSALITDSQEKAAAGVKVAGDVETFLEEINLSAQKVGDLLDEIAAASQEQAKGMEQVNAAVAQMDVVTQRNAATASENASASSELSGQSASLNEMVADLGRIVGHGGKRRDIRPASNGNGASPHHAKARQKPAPFNRISEFEVPLGHSKTESHADDSEASGFSDEAFATEAFLDLGNRTGEEETSSAEEVSRVDL